MRKQSQTIFMLGLAGSGMQAFAQILSAHGHTVTGTDFDVQKLSANPLLQSFTVAPESAAESLLARADRLIYTDAAASDHPLRQFARDHSIPEQMLFEAIGEFTESFTTIAVTGTHGKSSTTAFLGHILSSAGLDPTVQLGANVVGWPGGSARVGHSNFFVLEADEYRHHFLHVSPAHIIITAIDFDHPDFFTSLADVEAAYNTFIARLAPGGSVVVPAAVINAHQTISWPDSTIVVPPPPVLPLPIPGAHMRYNAMLAIQMAGVLGVPQSTAQAALASFPGLSRRFEMVGKIESMTLVSDYGHHPTEIAATLEAAREHYPGKRILAILEPHTAARVQSFLPLFSEALQPRLCDGVIIYPTFFVKGRDDEAQAHASTRQLLTTLSAQRSDVWGVVSDLELRQLLGTLAPQFDVAIAFTAGALDTSIRSFT